MTKEQIQKEIEGMDAYIPVKKIEEKLGMPPTTLQKVLKGERSLPKKWIKVLEAYFVKKEEVVELKVGDNKAWSKAFKEAGVKAKPSGTTRQPYMSDAIKKKLGIK